MAIVSISRIQNRRGIFNNFKGVQLAAAELGWAMDKRRLFIGNGEPAEGAVESGNTEILTEFSPLTDLIRHQYLWRGKDPLTGSLVPQVNPGWQVMRRLQERLDERVSVKSFGVRGDGNESIDAIEAETLNFRRAMYEIFMRDKFDPYPGANKDHLGGWRTLYIPAGLYIINRPIPLLRKTILVGDGSGRTIIMMRHHNNTAQNFVAGTATYHRQSATSTFDDYPDDATILDNFAFPPVADRDWSGGNGDNLNVGWPVQDIMVSGITFINNDSDQPTQGDVVRVDNASNVSFIDTEFLGAEYDCSQTPAYGGISTLPSCVRITGPSGKEVEFQDRTQQITFTDCKFRKRGYGIFVNDDVVQVSADSCLFHELYDGVNVGEDLNNVGSPIPHSGTEPYNHGPRNVQIRGSYFDMIRRYGMVVFTPASGNGSMFNHYARTGVPMLHTCELTSDLDLCDFEYEGVLFWKDPRPDYEGATGNYSIADTFDRPDIDYNEQVCTSKQGILYRIGNPNGRNTTIDDQNQAKMPNGAQFGRLDIDNMNVDGIPLSPTSGGPTNVNSISGDAIWFDLNHANTFIIEYSINRGDNYRVGVIRCVTNAMPDGSVVAEYAVDDDYNEFSSDVGVIFYFEQNPTELEKLHLKYTMSSGVDATFHFASRKWNSRPGLPGLNGDVDSITTTYLTQEDGDYILQEDDSRIIVE